MTADHFHARSGNARLVRKKRAQLGVCLAAFRRRRNPDLQRAIRKLARDFGFRTLRQHLYPQRRWKALGDPLLEQLMHTEPDWRYFAGSLSWYPPEQRKFRRRRTLPLQYGQRAASY